MSDALKASPTKRELERALIAAGMPARQAKKLLAAGYKASAGESDHDDDDGTGRLLTLFARAAKALRGQD